MMKKTYAVGAIASLAALAACEEQSTAPSAETNVADRQDAAEADRVYSTTGQVTVVTGSDVTIAHGPVPELQWPAMTMAFRAEAPELLAGIQPGDRVSFTFSQSGGTYVLSSITEN